MKQKEKLIQINMEENFSGYRDLVDEDFDFDKEMCNCGCMEKNDFAYCDCKEKSENKTEKKDLNEIKTESKKGIAENKPKVVKKTNK